MHWLPAQDATGPAGLVACGALARQVLALLRARDAAQNTGLTVVVTPDMLVLLGAAASLPWLDGVRYCAPDALVPMLWLPTDATPGLPADLVLANLAARGARLPFLLWDAPEQVLPLDQPVALEDATFTWLAQALA
jgi:hypothetical protein